MTVHGSETQSTPFSYLTRSKYKNTNTPSELRKPVSYLSVENLGLPSIFSNKYILYYIIFIYKCIFLLTCIRTQSECVIAHTHTYTYADITLTECGAWPNGELQRFPSASQSPITTINLLLVGYFISYLSIIILLFHQLDLVTRFQFHTLSPLIIHNFTQ